MMRRVAVGRNFATAAVVSIVCILTGTPLSFKGFGVHAEPTSRSATGSNTLSVAKCCKLRSYGLFCLVGKYRALRPATARYASFYLVNRNDAATRPGPRWVCKQPRHHAPLSCPG